MKIRFLEALRAKMRTTTREIEVEDEEEITDEIIKSLYELKTVFDLPTEEVEVAVKSRNIKS
jgi:hypothetical protein